MDDDILNLFSKKELFQLAHNTKGYSNLLKLIPPQKRRKMMDDNMHLINGISFHNGYPMIKPYTGPTDFTIVAYNERNKCSSTSNCLHFFLDDYRFRDAVWYNLERITYEISTFDYVFTPDFSLWQNLPTEYYNQKNLFRTRFVGAYWQECGFNVIPTASWGGLESFSYCFNGLPENSVIGVSAMGAKKSNTSFDLWCYGINRLVLEKHPTLILIYGGPFELPDINTSFKFLPTFISKHFQK